MLAQFTTYRRPVQELEPGDVYLVGILDGRRETREVLGILQRTPLGGALLEVKDPRCNVFRSHMGGRAEVLDASDFTG